LSLSRNGAILDVVAVVSVLYAFVRHLVDALRFDRPAARRIRERAIFMYMFLPFLIASLSGACVLFGKRALAYGLWTVLVTITLAWYLYHATDSLNLSF
jgi:hypothetical protein